MKARTMLAMLALIAAGEAVAHGRMADLSVYDRTEGRRLPVHWHEGRAYVVGKPGNEYQVTVRNRLREDVLAVVSVDGINVVSGETANPAQTGYVLSGQQSYDILGWRKSLAETAAFYFTALPDSYAARTGRPGDVGVIGVALFRRKAQRPQPLSEAAPAARSESRADARLGTGHGRREDSPAVHVTFERATSAPAEVITLYYDSHANLAARGIVRDPVGVVPLPRPRPCAVSVSVMLPSARTFALASGCAVSVSPANAIVSACAARVTAKPASDSDALPRASALRGPIARAMSDSCAEPTTRALLRASACALSDSVATPSARAFTRASACPESDSATKPRMRAFARG